MRYLFSSVSSMRDVFVNTYIQCVLKLWSFSFSGMRARQGSDNLEEISCHHCVLTILGRRLQKAHSMAKSLKLSF